MNPIVGIGELLWDIYPDGRKVAGGAPFNFAFHCHQLGHPAVIVSRVGDDALGRELRAEVRRLGLPDEFIQTDPAHPTGTVRVALDPAGVPTYTITDPVAWDFIGEEGPIDEGLAHDAVAVCFGTLARRHPVSRSTIDQFVSPGPGMPSALRVFDVNLRQHYFSPQVLNLSLSITNWVKLNAAEMNSLEAELPRPPVTSDPVTPRQWYDRLWVDAVDRDNVLIVTDGGAGVTVIRGNDGFTQPGVPTRVVDTVGAGDAFTAAMVCLHLEGRPLRDCVRFANHYAARVCEHQGATPHIDRAAVDRAVFGPA